MKIPYKPVNEMSETPYVEPCYGFSFVMETFEKENCKGKILDCGVGGNYFLHSIGDEFEKYGVDVKDLRVHQAGEFSLTDLNFEKLPYPDKHFDVVTAWCLLAHLENPHNFIREVYRVLKPGGVFFNEMPNISLRERKKFLLTMDLERYCENNDHISIFTPAVYKKTVLKYFNEVSVQYWVDPKIYKNRLGWLKKILIKRWPVIKKYFAAEVIQKLSTFTTCMKIE